MVKLRLFFALMLLSLALTGMAQDNEKKKQTKAELNEKASKTSRKEAKQLAKEGWKVSPGSLPMEKQLDRAYLMELAMDDDFNPIYVQGEGKSVGQVYDAAKMNATEVARQNLIGKISSEAMAIIETLMGNKQLTKDQAETVASAMSENTAKYTAKLGRVQTVVELYRSLNTGNVEVLVRMYAKDANIKAAARDAIRDQMEERGIEMNDEMKTILVSEEK